MHRRFPPFILRRINNKKLHPTRPFPLCISGDKNKLLRCKNNAQFAERNYPGIILECQNQGSQEWHLSQLFCLYFYAASSLYLYLANIYASFKIVWNDSDRFPSEGTVYRDTFGCTLAKQPEGNH